MSPDNEKPHVFVLMPFSDEFNTVYEKAIKPACLDIGAKCERVDEQIFSQPIPDQVYEQLGSADLLIAEMTDCNPNVLYEVGYAHGLGRKPILITKSKEGIPFDLRHFQHIVYSPENIFNLKDSLSSHIKHFLSNPNEENLSLSRRLREEELLRLFEKLDRVEELAGQSKEIATSYMSYEQKRTQLVTVYNELNNWAGKLSRYQSLMESIRDLSHYSAIMATDNPHENCRYEVLEYHKILLQEIDNLKKEV